MWSDEIALSISRPVLHGPGILGSISALMTEYRRTISRSGGYWEASWRFPLDVGHSGIAPEEMGALYAAEPFLQARESNEGVLRTWFETPYLMYHVEERAAGVPTWEGVVWEIELTLDGLTRRVSMERVWNAVRADYTDTAGNLQITDWFVEPESIALYGRKEMILRERYVGSDEAEGAAQSFLAEHAWPMPEVTEVGTTRRPGLFVQAVGYVMTANFQYVDTTAADGEMGDISEFVRRIVQYDCEFLQAGNIETNTLPRYRRFDGLMRAWDAIEALCEMGAADNTPWLATVFNERRLNYEPADSTPTLFWRGAEQGVTSGTGDINAWLVRPGVMRDMTGVISSARPGAFLQESRDIWINEVEMAQGRKQPILKPSAFDPLAILRAKDQYMDWLADEEETGG